MATKIYCDESGGLSAGVMTFAAVQLDEAAAEAILARFRAITGLRGELKGSRISIAERGLLVELAMQHGLRGWVAEARRADWEAGPPTQDRSDLALYGRLLQLAVSRSLPEVAGGCLEVVIDEGRYDPRILAMVESDVEALLGGWAQASLANSARCAGVQIADVVANSFFNLGMAAHGSDAAVRGRARRIHAMIAPYLADGRLREARLSAD